MDFSTPCTSCSEWRYSRNTNFLYRWNGTSWIIYNPGSTLNLGLSMPGIFNVSPSTLTGSGTFNVTLNSQAQNTFLAAPSNASGVPTFRTLTPSDLSVAGGLSGTSSAGRVAFYTGTSTLTGDANLTWDNSDKSLSLGGSGVSSSLLTLNSTTRGILIPRMTTTQKNAIVAPATGLLVYDLTLGAFNVYNGSAWVSVGGGLPAGSNGQIQFNNNNVFGASSNLFWDNTNARFTVNGSLLLPKTTAEWVTQGNSRLIRFTNIGDVGGWNGGFEFSAGSNNVENTATTLRVRGAQAGEAGVVGVGNLTEGNLQLLSTSSTLAVRGRRTTAITYESALNLGTSLINDYRKEQSRFFGIHLGGASTGNPLSDFSSPDAYGAFIGYQYDPLSNGYAGSLVFLNRNDNAVQTENFRIQGKNGNIGINSSNPLARLHLVAGNSDNTATALLIQNSLARTLFSVRNDGLAQLGRNTAVTTQSVAQVEVVSDDTNTGLVLTPKGDAAFILGPAPDGTAVGGNARGNGAIDFQRIRDTNTKVASGTRSVIINGNNNTASATYAAVISGNANIASAEAALASGQSTASGAYSTALGVATASGNRSAALGGGRALGQFSFSAGEISTGGASGDFSVALGYRNTASGTASFAVNGGMAGIGGGNIASGNFSSAFGRGSRAYLMGQIALASYDNHAQTSFVDVRSIVTGNTITELFINGTTERLVPALPTGQASGRIWNARIQCVATVVTQGTGTAPAGSSFIQTYDVGIKRIGNTTTLIGGAPIATSATGDNAMSGANFIITADDTNEALKVEFQPPSTVGSDTVIRAIATIYLTELGY